jgi:hypothetical protein
LQTLTLGTVLPPSSGITSSGPSSLWRSSRQVSYTIRYLSKGCPNIPPHPSSPPSFLALEPGASTLVFTIIYYIAAQIFRLIWCVVSNTILCRPTPRLNRSGTCSGSPYAILVNRWRSGAVCDHYNSSFSFYFSSPSGVSVDLAPHSVLVCL